MKTNETLDNELLDDESLNMLFITRLLIIIGSSILIGLIWLFMIPFCIFITIPTGYFMHEFDFVMQPYFWFYMAWNNKRI